VTGLAGAATVELLILRLFTRTALHIPAIEQLSGPYEMLTVLGRYAYYLSALLLVVTLPVLGLALWQRAALPLRVASLAVLTATGAAAAARFASPDPVLVYVLLAGSAMVLAIVGATTALRTALAILPFGAALGLAAVSLIAETLASRGEVSLDPAMLLAIAEYPAFVFAVVAPLAFGVRPSRRVVVVGAVAGAVVLAMFLGNPSTSRILLLWNWGFSGVLPSTAYAVGFAALAGTLTGLHRDGRTLAGLGLILLIAGGFGLQNTYQASLVVVGLGVLCLAPALDRRSEG
jgi:hypothetical protein